MSIRPRTKAELFLLSVTLIWGTTFVLTKIVLEHVSPFVYIALRFGIASVLFGSLFPRRILSLKKDVVVKGGILGLLLVSGFALQTVGLQYTTASKSAFITGMLVVFTPVCQLIIERKPPKVGNVLGVLLVSAGLYFLTSPEGSSLNIGDAMTLGCALTFALYIVYLDLFGKEHDSAQLTFMQFISSTVVGVMLAVGLESPVLKINTTFLAVLAYLAIFATIIAMYVQTRYQKDTTPTRSAVIFSAEPVIAALFAYWVIDERLGMLGVVGGGMIVAGVLVSELSDYFINSGKVRDQA
ncbi:MAG: DMT family transporter [Bacteroidota bacterium]